MTRLLFPVRRTWPVWLALGSGLALTLGATLLTIAGVATAQRRELQLIGDELVGRVQVRLAAHAQLLSSGAGLFAASADVRRAEWRTFVEQSRVHFNLPGIQGIGFARWIPAGGLARHEQEVRAEGFPDYRVWPPGERPAWSAIQYLEPFTGRNLRAFGYDMFAEPVRRAAMERARDQDRAALSGKVTLVQETDQDVQAGALMYVPVYRKGLPAATLEERRAALVGWVYSPYRMNDLMQGILGGGDLLDSLYARLAIYDGDRLEPATLLYDSQPAAGPESAPGAADLLLPLDFNGHRWTLSVSRTRSFTASYLNPLVLLVALSGTLISLLVAALLRALVAARARSRQLAAELATRETVSAVAGLAAASPSAEQFRRDLAPLLVSRLGFPSVAIEVYDPERGEMVFAGIAGLSGVSPGLRVPLAETLSGPVALAGQSRLELDARAIPDALAPALRALGIVTFASVPLRQGQRVLGALSIGDTRPRSEVQALLATLLAVAETVSEASGRLEAQAALAESERRYRGLVDNLAAGVIVHAADTRIQFANPMALRLLGIMADGISERLAEDPRWQFIRADGTPLSVADYPVTRALATGVAIRDFSFGIVRPDRPEPLWVLCQAYPIRDAAERIVQVLVTFFDVTALKRAEAELEQHRHHLEGLVESRTRELSAARDAAESANRAKSAFLANMSHELRTPLNGVLGLAQLLRGEPLGDHQRRLLERILESGQSLLGLLSDILDLARIEAGVLQFALRPFDLAQRLARLERLMVPAALAKGLALRITGPEPPLAPLLGDALRLEQALLNLVGNALKFTGEGQVRLRVLPLELTATAARLRFEIADTGIGISPERLASLFAPFTQAAEGDARPFGGAGLGLSISKRLVELMGGRIGAESQVGQGSTFWCELAFRWADAAPLAGPADPADVAGAARPVPDGDPDRVPAESAAGGGGWTFEPGPDQALYQARWAALQEALVAHRPRLARQLFTELEASLRQVYGSDRVGAMALAMDALRFDEARRILEGGARA